MLWISIITFTKPNSTTLLFKTDHKWRKRKNSDHFIWHKLELQPWVTTSINNTFLNVRGVPSSNNSVSWVSAQVNIYIEQGYFRLFSFFAPLEISIDDGLLGSREIPNPSINPKSGLQFIVYCHNETNLFLKLHLSLFTIIFVTITN